MPTWTALTTLTGQTNAIALGEALEALHPAPTGVGVFEVEDGSEIWEVGGYFESAPSDVALALLSAAYQAQEFVVSEVPDTDWVAHVRRELPPVVAGRFFVYGSHDADQVPSDKIALLIEASMAFGTGHHGTTLGCLQALERLIEDNFVATAVADIGCGSAVLAMAAAQTWLGDVLASDIDPVAVDVAKTNVLANGLVGRVNCLEATGFDHPQLKGEGQFDLIFANILKGPLIDLAPDLKNAICKGGYAILSGILNTQADEVLSVYFENGFSLADRTEIVDWTTLTLVRN